MKFNEISLIANFFTGMNLFASEVFHNSIINTLQLDNAVIIMKKSNDVIYAIQADFETIELRMNFEIYIENTLNYVLQLDPSEGIDVYDQFLLQKSDSILIQ